MASDAATLPIELKSIEAKWIEDQVQLDWITLSEKNNDYFEIMRSPDAKNWEVLAIVDGSGTTDQERHYQWMDTNPYTKDNYYRLNQVDYDGAQELHQIIWVTHEFRYPARMILYGNPIPGRQLELEIENVDWSKASQIQIMDLGGKSIQTIHMAEPGRKAIPLDPLLPGTYLLRARIGDEEFLERIILNP